MLGLLAIPRCRGWRGRDDVVAALWPWEREGPSHGEQKDQILQQLHPFGAFWTWFTQSLLPLFVPLHATWVLWVWVARWTKLCVVSIFQVTHYFEGGRDLFTLVRRFLFFLFFFSWRGTTGTTWQPATAAAAAAAATATTSHGKVACFPPIPPCLYLSPPPRLLSPSFYKNRLMTCLPPVVSGRLTQQTAALGKHPGLPPSVGLRLPLPLQSVSMATATTRTTNCLALAMAQSVSAWGSRETAGLEEQEARAGREGGRSRPCPAPSRCQSHDHLKHVTRIPTADSARARAR